jgi:hypothetical protein
MFCGLTEAVKVLDYLGTGDSYPCVPRAVYTTDNIRKFASGHRKSHQINISVVPHLCNFLTLLCGA